MLKLDWNLLFNLINLIVFYFLMKRFLFSPIMKVMDERKKIINDGLSQAKSSQEEALALKNKYEAALSDARETSEKIMADAKENAKLEYDRIVKAADEEAKASVLKARKTIEAEKENTMRDLQSQVAALALSAAKKVTSSKSTIEDDLNLYERFLEEAGDKDVTNHK